MKKHKLILKALLQGKTFVCYCLIRLVQSLWIIMKERLLSHNSHILWVLFSKIIGFFPGKKNPPLKKDFLPRKVKNSQFRHELWQSAWVGISSIPCQIGGKKCFFSIFSCLMFSIWVLPNKFQTVCLRIFDISNSLSNTLIIFICLFQFSFKSSSSLPLLDSLQFCLSLFDY